MKTRNSAGHALTAPERGCDEPHSSGGVRLVTGPISLRDAKAFIEASPADSRGGDRGQGTGTGRHRSNLPQRRFGEGSLLSARRLVFAQYARDAVSSLEPPSRIAFAGRGIHGIERQPRRLWDP